MPGILWPLRRRVFALNEQSGDRFLLGLGVSHAPLVEGLRGHCYDKPLQTMRNYLTQVSKVRYSAPVSEGRSEVVLAALGPRVLELAAELTDGAHPYNVTPEHKARALGILGPHKRPYMMEKKVLLETDPIRACGMAKAALGFYMGLPNYRRTWLSLGFSEEDLSGPSDRFLDAMVAWGDEIAIRKRLEEHFQAGADQACIQPLGVLDLLAPANS